MECCSTSFYAENSLERIIIKASCLETVERANMWEGYKKNIGDDCVSVKRMVEVLVQLAWGFEWSNK